MKNTIKVVPYKVGIDLNGRVCSMFSAGLDRIETTNKFTWQVTDHNGSTTHGLCRVPVDSEETARAIADTVAEKRGYTVI